LLALIPFPAFAFEVSDVQLMRMNGSTNILCKQSYEVGKESYFPEVLNASANDAEVTISLKAKFVLCSGGQSEQHWENRSPLDAIPVVDSQGKPGRIELRAPEFVLSSGSFGLLGSVAVPNEHEASVSLVFPLATGLSAQEKAALEAGEAVQVRASILYRAIAKLVNESGEAPLGWRLGTAYTVFFSLKK
jgi:hypothetical protein